MTKMVIDLLIFSKIINVIIDSHYYFNEFEFITVIIYNFRIIRYKYKKKIRLCLFYIDIEEFYKYK